MNDYVIWFQDLSKNDVEKVGGKNASLGEMISNLSGAGVSVPGGFATTAHAYREFLDQNGLNDKIHNALDKLDVNDVIALAETGKEIRDAIIKAPFQPELESAIKEAYEKIASGNDDMSFAVRSSATAEDLPDASFAGQQETAIGFKTHNARTAFCQRFVNCSDDIGRTNPGEINICVGCILNA